MSRLQSVSINSGAIGLERVRYNILVLRAAADGGRAAAVNNLRTPEVCPIQGVRMAPIESSRWAQRLLPFFATHPPTSGGKDSGVISGLGHTLSTLFT